MTVPGNRKQGSVVVTTYGEGLQVQFIVTKGRQGIASLPYVEAGEEYARGLFLVNDGGDGEPPADTLAYVINGSTDTPGTVYLEYFDSDGASVYTDAVTIQPGGTKVRSVRAAVEIP